MKRLGSIIAAMAMVGALFAGCGGGGGGGAGIAATSGGDGGPVVAADTTPPVVLYTTPANNDSGVGTNSKVTVTFSESMDPASVTESSFQLIDTTAAPSVPVSGTAITYDPANRIATLSAPPLAGNHLYSARVTTGVKDQAGNAMVAEYAWTFTTAAAADLTPPVIMSQAPGIGANGVDIAASVAMSFSKPMDLASVESAFSLKETANGSAVAGAFSTVGEVVVFTPAALLKPGTNYTVTLTTAATDLAGTPLAADVTWRFTTGGEIDSTPPTVTSVTPTPGATGVSRTTSISATFDEAIYPELFGSINGVVAKVVLDYATNTLIMTPTVPLDPGGYTVRVQASDLSGNRMSTPYEWTFTTVN